MKSKRTVVALTALVLTLIVGTVAVSQTTRRGHRHRSGMFGPRALAFFSEYLDLSDAQQAQAKQILAKEKPTLKPLLQQLAETHHQLRQYEESGNFNEAQVRLLASQQAQTITELVVQKARIESELVQVLTPEQKAKLTQFIDRREQKFRDRLTGNESPSTDVE